MSERPTVSLALGSGGARGLAHIGIIKWLEDNGYVISAIAGSSMGALVGGIHAIGKLKEYEEWACAITKRDILSLLDLSLGTDGLIKGDKIIGTLRSLVGDELIENLPLDFTAVAANISRRKEVWLREGSLFDAIRASISLPLVFKPVVIDGDDIIDGGILNPVPIAPTFSDLSDYTIAVNLCAPQEEDAVLPNAVVETEGVAGAISQKIGDFVGSLTERITIGKQDIKAYNIVYKSFDAMQGTIARQKIAAYPPDCVINVPVNICGMMEFDRARQLIQYGYEKAAKELPRKLR